jgi:hypothetical protein
LVVRIWQTIAALVGLAVVALVVSVQYVMALQYSGPPPGPRYDLAYYASALLFAVVSLPTAIAVLVLAAVMFAIRRASRQRG